MRWQATEDVALYPWVHTHLSFSEESFLCNHIPPLSVPACSASETSITKQNQGSDLSEGQKVQKELSMQWYTISEPELSTEQGEGQGRLQIFSHMSILTCVRDEERHPP